MKKTFLNKIMLVMISCMLLTVFASSVFGQTDSLAVWENIADGTLTSTWSETSNSNWKGQNVSGIWSYNNTATTSLNWTYNNTIKGIRWMQTWEATCDDSEGGIGSAMFIDSTHYYAVIYYLSFNGTDPAIYIIYDNAGTVSYWDSTPGSWTTNISNATDYTNYEKDYENGWVRFKAIWNWNEELNNCTVRFKAWETSGDEFPLWLCDTIITAVAPTTSTYPGFVVDKRWDLDPATTLFRRIFFWNLSYTMTPGLNHVIDCPTVSAFDVYNAYADAYGDDIWNSTQLLKSFINLFDLTSIYSEAFYGNVSNQNDTIYSFFIMLTDCHDFAEQFFPVVPDEFPDNILFGMFFLTTDGSSNDEDYMLLRIDTDDDQTYEATDYAVWTNDTDTIAYRGWTENFGYEENVILNSGSSLSYPLGEVFRDKLYYYYGLLLNWDSMYNGTSGERIMDDQCRMSIMWYDNDTDNTSILQDFYPTNDDSPYVATDERNISNSPTWEGANDSSFWTLFNVDTSISGEPLADPDDPSTGEAITIQLSSYVIPVVFAALFLIFILTLILSGNITPESLIAIMIIAILGIITLMMLAGL